MVWTLYGPTTSWYRPRSGHLEPPDCEISVRTLLPAAHQHSRLRVSQLAILTLVSNLIVSDCTYRLTWRLPAHQPEADRPTLRKLQSADCPLPARPVLTLDFSLCSVLNTPAVRPHSVSRVSPSENVFKCQQQTMKESLPSCDHDGNDVGESLSPYHPAISQAPH